MIERQIKADIELTSLELASEFCEMSADQQALFFNYIEDFSEEWGSPLCFQIQAIAKSKNLLRSGNNVMRMLGEYAK